MAAIVYQWVRIEKDGSLSLSNFVIKEVKVWRIQVWHNSEIKSTQHQPVCSFFESFYFS